MKYNAAPEFPTTCTQDHHSKYRKNLYINGELKINVVLETYMCIWKLELDLADLERCWICDDILLRSQLHATLQSNLTKPNFDTISTTYSSTTFYHSLWVVSALLSRKISPGLPLLSTRPFWLLAWLMQQTISRLLKPSQNPVFLNWVKLCWVGL